MLCRGILQTEPCDFEASILSYIGRDFMREISAETFYTKVGIIFI